MTHPDAQALVCPPRNDTVVVCEWRPCWWCALPLDDDEVGLCCDCDADLNPLGPRLRLWGASDLIEHPLEHLLRFDEDLIEMMGSAVVDHELARVADTAYTWAADHDLEPAAATAYKRAAVACATKHLRARIAEEARVIEEQRRRRVLRWVQANRRGAT